MNEARLFFGLSGGGPHPYSLRVPAKIHVR